MGNRTIRDEITIDAPPGEVLGALTEPERLERWMATEVESDPRTGGRFRYQFDFEDPAQNTVQEGEYLAVDGEQVELPWIFPFAPGTQTTVAYRVTEQGDGTRVEFEHRGFEEGEPWDGAFERFTGGWRMFLEGLKRSIETGEQSLPLGMKSS